MNKALLGSITLSLALLASCSSENNSTADNNIDNNDNASVSPAPEDNLPENNLPDDSDEDSTQENPLSQALADAIIYSQVSEASETIPMLTSAEDEMSGFIFPMLDFDPENAKAYAISVSAMNVHAYGIVAIVPEEGQEETIIAGLQKFIDTQVQNFTGYLPDQLEIAQSARLETLSDGTVLMVMCENQDHVFDTIAPDGVIASS